MRFPKRLLALIGVILICFLALYTWDARTGKLSNLSSMSGLEVTGQVLSPGVWVKDKFSGIWDNYIALSDVAAENSKLREELGYYRQEVLKLSEEKQELERLRLLVSLPDTGVWEQTGARIIAGKFGPQAALNSVMINKGFSGGALPGAPVISRNGLVGKVFHSSMHAANVVLMDDPSFRVAVIGQESRVRGVLAGGGARRDMEVLYVAPNYNMKLGELLICSGLDGQVPKGLPAARVTSVSYDKDMLFLKITAEPVVELGLLEEVVVLVPPKGVEPGDLLYNPFPMGQPEADGGEMISDEEAAKSMGN